MKKFKRIFVIVMDSAGIGAMNDAPKFGDSLECNTFVHVSERCNGLKIPNMEAMGLADLGNVKGTTKVNHPQAYSLTLTEASNGKDTMTGHWEMMGIHTTKAFKTFTDTGFPAELIKELEEKTGRKCVGNYAASGTEILKEWGEHQMQTGDLIVYTSSDSVLQICGHEETIGVPELYRCCEIAREICMKPEWLLGRIIARPYIGTNKDNFKRTANRHDLALSPTGTTAMDVLKDNGFDCVCVGKIADIFNNCGVTEKIKTVSNVDGMEKTIAIAKDNHFNGLCFVNLVEFDSEYGHRRNPLGYGQAFETFDNQLTELLQNLGEDDLLMITADHGNDPTQPGTDHTREQVPLLCYSKAYANGKHIATRPTFASIGATVLKNFGLEKAPNCIGESIDELLND